MLCIVAGVQRRSLFNSAWLSSATKAHAAPATSAGTDGLLVDEDKIGEYPLPDVKWADYRPHLVEVVVQRNEEGDLVGKLGDEECIFPEMEFTLEWVLPTPVPLHCFEERPIVKECPEE